MIRRVLFLIVILLQVTFLIGMIVSHQKKLQTGFPLRLIVEPINPHDITPGESVRLGYAISKLDLSKMAHDPGRYSRGSTIYVILSKDTIPDSPIYVPKSIHLTQPKPDQFPFIQGKILWSNSTPTSKFYFIHIDYQIGQYYVQEGRGKEIESAMGPFGHATTRRVSVEIRLAKDGTPAIAKLFVDNREFQ